MPSRTTRFLLAALAAATAAAWPGTARASKMDARLQIVRAKSAAAIRPAGAPEPTRRVLIRLQAGVTLAAMRAAYPSVAFGSQAGAVVTASAPDSALAAFDADPRVVSVQAARLFHPNLDVVRSNQSSGGLYLGTTLSGVSDLANVDGSGVVVGVVDTGIDYRHADFQSSGVSRIKWIWDQTDAGGPAQSLVSCSGDCGSDWTNADINSSLGSGSPVRERDTEGHGTHVAGIAAGNGSAGNGTLPAGTFIGLAPKADLVIVKTDFTDAGILDGMSYIVARAASLGERAVINLSLGNQMDPHDGTSNFDVGVAAIAASTPVVVAMGNDGGSSPHSQASSLAFNATDNYAVSVAGWSADAEVDFWGSSSDSYSLTVTMAGTGCSGMNFTSGTTSSYSCAGATVFISSANNTPGSGTTSGANLEMYVWVSSGGVIQSSQIGVAVTCTRPAGCGRLDGYVTPGSEGTAFVAAAGYTVTTDQSMAAPATANNVFAVGSYASKISWLDFAGASVHYTNGQALGVISDFSASGPTRDGRQKPDVAAPGEGIGSTLSADSPICSTCTFDSLSVLQDGLHAILQGTSMAAPAVAGILATRLQGHPSRTVSDLRAIIQGAARSDSAVTGWGATPNSVFGYGKVVASPQPQGAPSGLSAAALGVSSITWSWNGTLVSADAFNVYVATNSSQLLAGPTQPPYTQTGLIGNTTYGILLRGEGGGVDGAAAFITTATYAAAPSAAVSVSGFASSVTVTMASCSPPPSASSCSGYIVEASSASNFSGTIFSSATASRLQTVLSLTGLSANSNYSLRIGALNPLGAITYRASTTSFATGSSLAAPTTPAFDLISTGTIRFNWAQGSNPGGLTYTAQASTASDYTGTLQSLSVTALNASFGGLSADTSYYFRVQAVGGPYLLAGPSATFALAPAVSTAPFVGVSISGLTAAWSNPGNPADTLYKADLAASSDFASVLQTVYTRTTAAPFSGLASNTVYYARAQAVSRSGSVSAETVLGSTSTLVQAPGSPAVTSVSTEGFHFSFTTPNPAGTVYAVRVATAASYTTVTAAVQTTAGSADFAGLAANQLYFVSAAALNQFGTPTAFVGVSTATFPTAPLPADPAVTTRTATGFGFAWRTGSLASGTVFVADVSSSPAFAAPLTTLLPTVATAAFSGLQPNTTYYGRVKAASSNPPTPDGPYLTAASGSTLADAPTAAAQGFAMVAFTSMTVAWTPLPLSPSSRTAEGYRVELSTAAGFPTLSATATVGAGASSATVTGLAVATTYYARVASLNWEGVPNYLTVSGSTATAMPSLSSGTMTSAGLILSVAPPVAALTMIRLEIAGGTFPDGTTVSAITSVGVSVIGARSNEAAGLTPFGPSTAFDLYADGFQPSAPIRLTITYDPARIPAGEDESRLHLWRYDPASAQWTLMPSQADPVHHQLIASIQHFSSFAPFFVTAGTDLSAVQVFPQPWELGDPSSRFWASQLSMTGLPGGARVRLLSLTGEEVVRGDASAGGVFTWDGSTRFGHRAASGTYIAIIESGAAKLVRRVVLLR